jgi:hypothetical protein
VAGGLNLIDYLFASVAVASVDKDASALIGQPACH